ncbi:hypothetical protein [Flavobacterium akiainvivens]|uniref:hypothetical protein n=1 Tax=Flavobacterium akiainvivens TaxID=1202724 RepID=UPI0008DF6EC6|nr:hypothetical protein [Flavobacterium akiainvivens]SFQ45205.1 hypothetical protein SAMN05444144_1057 [Flavobacterium akiainvivens]
MKRPFFIILCVFIVLFAVANRCDKLASLTPPVENSKSYITPTQPARPGQARANWKKNTAETNICDECGGRFFGRGYTEIAHGQWQETEEPYQSFICSRACGRQHTRKWEEKSHKLHTTAQPAKPSGYRNYNNENSIDDPCGLCGGTGYESNRYGDARICPQCEGTGKRNN